jgi:hypothetical protein
MLRTKHRTWGWTAGVVAGALLLAGCGASSTPAAGANTPSGGAPTAPASGAVGGNGAADTSTSAISDVCSVVTKADLDTAFGGTWDAMSGSSGPLTCAFDLTGNETSSALAAGSAVEVVLKPGYYATSGMALAQSVDGLGEQAGVLGNTLFIKRGVDVIEILTMPFDGSPNAQAAMVALGKAIYLRF